MSFFLSSSSKLYSVNNKIFSFLKNFVFIVVFTIVYKRKSAVKFQTDTIKKCLSEPTWTQMRAKSKQTKLSPWIAYMCVLTALWGTGANLTFPPTAALSLSTVWLGNLRSLLCFLVSQLPQLEKRGTSLVQATKSNNTWFLLFHNVQVFLKLSVVSGSLTELYFQQKYLKGSGIRQSIYSLKKKYSATYKKKSSPS